MNAYVFSNFDRKNELVIFYLNKFFTVNEFNLNLVNCGKKLKTLLNQDQPEVFVVICSSVINLESQVKDILYQQSSESLIFIFSNSLSFSDYEDAFNLGAEDYFRFKDVKFNDFEKSLKRALFKKAFIKKKQNAELIKKRMTEESYEKR